MDPPNLSPFFSIKAKATPHAFFPQFKPKPPFLLLPFSSQFLPILIVHRIPNLLRFRFGVCLSDSFLDRKWVPPATLFGSICRTFSRNLPRDPANFMSSPSMTATLIGRSSNDCSKSLRAKVRRVRPDSIPFLGCFFDFVSIVILN